ncbi:MAG: TraR/DksA C4-type zinc finger protein [Desulfosarcina sp.]|jgi:DnaK suppressor protein
MNKRDLKSIHRQLHRWLENLSRNADCNLDGLNGADETLPDIVDQASSSIERALFHNLCDRETLLMKKIERALEDISNGIYGICNNCGEDIAVKRLKASPITRYCIDCKTALETRKRLTGT